MWWGLIIKDSLLVCCFATTGLYSTCSAGVQHGREQSLTLNSGFKCLQIVCNNASLYQELLLTEILLSQQ